MTRRRGTAAAEGLHTTLPGLPSSLKKQVISAACHAPALHARTPRQILYWLTWLPLLSALELARLVRRDGQTTRGHLLQLERLQLVAHVVCDEPEWSPRHYRYYLTDLGLYTLAALYPEASQVTASQLARSYPVTRQDLLARLARLPVHLILSELVSRLLAECPPGYQLTGYQHPCEQSYPASSRRHRWASDAAFLLAAPDGTHHAFSLWVDQPERQLSQKEALAWLRRLAELQAAARLVGESLPPQLILTERVRIPLWLEQLEQAWELRALKSSLPPCALADYHDLSSQGAFTPLWLPIETGSSSEIRSTAPRSRVSLLALCQQGAAGPLTLIEGLTRPLPRHPECLAEEGGAVSEHAHRLPRYVYESLQAEAERLCPQQRQDLPAISREIAREFAGAPVERTRMAALLTLQLSAQQKQILSILARHPWMSLPDIQMQLSPGYPDPRLIQRHLKALLAQELVSLSTWTGSRSWQERERYVLTETGLRYLAVRHGVPSTQYLSPGLSTRPAPLLSSLEQSSGWVQRGVGDLNRQMAHTQGVYWCVRQITAAGRQTGTYEILAWRSAREAIRWPWNCPGSHSLLIRPDAELLYTVRESSALYRLLLEYDRGTTSAREYTQKFAAYADYQDETRTILPPIVVVAQSEQTCVTIERVLREIQARMLPVVLLLADEVRRTGLHSLLPQLLALTSLSSVC
ncbi:replication-relaxation family protein [Thermogemmatispora carboxidivorans]|uniref:replication-relaxation family protein n=1 Tax=Thermogemmatispora carboxidivorans TaxID=1382306 RepID=UPI00069AFB98|nr:replication-relaxation family protein [Thermogemmatispora carboxidivorans]